MTPTARPLRLATTDADFETRFAARLHWSAETEQGVEDAVGKIIADVRARGDAAVLEYTARFDGVSATDLPALEVQKEELKAAFDALPSKQREALEAAAARVRSYHQAQKKAGGESWSYRDDDG